MPVLPVQVFVAGVLGFLALAWIAFDTTARNGPGPARHGWHLLVPAFVLFCRLFAPAFVDLVIPVVYVLYGAGLLIALRHGVDDMPLRRLESGDLPARLWRYIAVALILSGLSDVLIVVAMIAGLGQWQPWIISIFGTGALLAIGALSFSDSLFSAPQNGLPEETASPDTEGDAWIMARLDTLMREKTVYLDPDLTLSQLSRRLLVPAKTLSTAINRSTGENVSRYINAHRIAESCRLLTSGASVTETMLDSGFNTKSNFNREFLRVTGETPSGWKEKRAAPMEQPVL